MQPHRAAAPGSRTMQSGQSHYAVAPCSSILGGKGSKKAKKKSDVFDGFIFEELDKNYSTKTKAWVPFKIYKLFITVNQVQFYSKLLVLVSW